MAFNTRGAGVTTRSNPKTEYGLMAVENIAKGLVVQTNLAGFTEIATEATTLLGYPFFVTTQALDNSGGSAGDLTIGKVGAGEFVTVNVDATAPILSHGDPVKVGATAGHVTLWVTGSDPEAEKIGVFLRKEGGIITRAANTSDDELFTDGGDYGVGNTLNATADQIIEIRIGQ